MCDQNPEHSFYRFPQVPETRKKWLHAIRQASIVVAHGIRICSTHFKVVGGRRRKNDFVICPNAHRRGYLDAWGEELGDW